MANLALYDQQNLFGSDVTLAHLLGPDDLCYVIQKEISPLIKDSDFESMYKEGGRPPISPRLLVLVLLMQFLEGLSDRAAARNLKFRLDWKIAFGLAVDFASIHPSTLTYFRDRLLTHEKASLAFDRVLEHLKVVGLVKASGKQRIDSTHVIGAVRELTRIELLHETLRLFCMDAGAFRFVMDDSIAGLYQHYTDPVSAFRKSAEEKKETIKQAGVAMQTFIVWTESSPLLQPLASEPSFATVKTVFAQNFTFTSPDQPPELIAIATGKDHICNPHDPEAEYANKGKKGWLGYKVQVAETVTEGETNFITHIELESATSFDGDCVQSVVTDLQTLGIAPLELYGDTHYNTTANIEALGNEGIDLKGEVPLATKEKSEKDQGFIINLEEQKAICPEGVESKDFKLDITDKVRASFPSVLCSICLRREVCKPNPRGKIYEQRLENKTLAERREKMKDPDYKKDLHHRNGIEGTLSGLVRGQKMRRSRYRGKGKNQLQTKMTGAAANIQPLSLLRQRQNYEQMKVAA